MEFNEFNYHMPVRLVFGNGTISELGNEAKQLGQRALIVSYRSNDWVEEKHCELCDLLNEKGVDVVGLVGVDPEPNPESIDEIVAQLKQEKVDMIISMGGGSVLDASKGIAVVLSRGGNVWDYVGRGLVDCEVLPIIAIPTTAGTGSEVTPYAIFKNNELNRKAGIVSPYIYPKVAILDPEMTLGLPPQLTAISGVDAFAHAIESYTSPTRNHITNAITGKAIELIGRNLIKAIQDGSDIDARSAMLLGSSLAGIGIAHVGTGIAHALGATLGGFYPLHHGLVVGLFLPEAIRYNSPVAKGLYTEVAKLIGIEVTNLSEEEASERLALEVENWLILSGLKSSLHELGVARSDFPEMVSDTLTQNSVGNNIRPVDKQAIEKFYDLLY